MYLLPGLLLTIGLALLVANFGTVVRERMQIVIFLVPLMGLGWSIRHPAKATAPGATSRPEQVNPAGARTSTVGSR